MDLRELAGAVDPGFMAQIRRMMESVIDPARRARVRSEMWDTPLGAAFAALSKTQRVLAIRPRDIALVGRPGKQAEELREAASYLLRAAQLIEGSPEAER